MKQSRSCPVCESMVATLLHYNELAPIDMLDMSYSLSECNNCNFIFADKLPSNSQYLFYYEKLSKYDTQFTVSDVDRYRTEKAVSFLTERVSKDATILDVGCGFGVMLSALRDAGYTNLSGIDPAPHSGLQASEQFKFNEISQGTIEGINKAANLSEISLICLMCVLEHLPDIKSNLSNLAKQLQYGTKLMVEVPALDLYDGTGGEPFGELSIEHIQYFTATSMTNFLNSLGFKIIDAELFAMPHLKSGSLFVLAELSMEIQKITPDRHTKMRDYLRNSELRWQAALKNIPDELFVLYGAGSHSARLVPKLTEKQKNNLVAVIDGNVNLHGKKFGGWEVEPPEAIKKYSELSILISSYRSEKLIADSIKTKFQNQKLKLMYSDV
jgi:2-polyprenyl-3-methyl-5-hydroxy-6-metoxy-1,4-benzoquinol methylase